MKFTDPITDDTVVTLTDPDNGGEIQWTGRVADLEVFNEMSPSECIAMRMNLVTNDRHFIGGGAAAQYLVEMADRNVAIVIARNGVGVLRTNSGRGALEYAFEAELTMNCPVSVIGSDGEYRWVCMPFPVSQLQSGSRRTGTAA
ncbi:MAG TPA: hypothetical protein VK504_17410 [Vicinamibacterales bacterium]|nr:hypothetical protein [Vicinamibacterales bacterium]